MRNVSDQGRTKSDPALLLIDVAVDFPVYLTKRRILTGNINPQVTTEMRVFILTFKVSFAHISMTDFSFLVRFNVVICISHG